MGSNPTVSARQLFDEVNSEIYGRTIKIITILAVSKIVSAFIGTEFKLWGGVTGELFGSGVVTIESSAAINKAMCGS